MKFGLSDDQLRQVQAILSKYPAITEAVVFGSRAMGNYKEASDVDVALKGDVTLSMVADVKYELEEDTYLPFFFDIIAYGLIDAPKLKEHIDKYGVALYRAGWKEYKLGDLGVIVTGKTPSINHPSDFGSDIPFVTPTDYKNYHKTASFAGRSLSFAGADKLKKKILPPQSVMVTCIGSDMGKVAINTTPVVTNQQINSIVPDINKVNPDFLYYGLVESYDILRSYGLAGTAVPIVNKKDFESIAISVPPLPEQRAVSAVLSSLDDKIDLLHRQNKTLEGMASALWRKMFIEEVAPNLKTGKLGDYGRIVCGKTPSKKVAEYFGGSVPFIKIPDMHGNVFLFETEDTLTEKGAQSQRNKTIPARSICVSCIATVGLVGMNAFDSQTNQQINTIVPSQESYRYFLFLLMRNMTDDLLARAGGGTATDNLNTGDFSRIEVPVPSENLIQEFDNLVTHKFEKIYTNQAQILKLIQLRDTILPKLMSGEVRVAI